MYAAASSAAASTALHPMRGVFFGRLPTAGAFNVGRSRRHPMNAGMMHGRPPCVPACIMHIELTQQQHVTPACGCGTATCCCCRGYVGIPLYHGSPAEASSSSRLSHRRGLLYHPGAERRMHAPAPQVLQDGCEHCMRASPYCSACAIRRREYNRRVREVVEASWVEESSGAAAAAAAAASNGAGPSTANAAPATTAVPAATAPTPAARTTAPPPPPPAAAAAVGAAAVQAAAPASTAL